MGLDNQKKCHAGKYEQDSMEELAPFKKARTDNPHVEVCKASATCTTPLTALMAGRTDS